MCRDESGAYSPIKKLYRRSFGLQLQGARPDGVPLSQRIPRAFGRARKRLLPLTSNRLRTKFGAPKAITAMAHRLARLVYRMLKYGLIRAIRESSQ